MSKWTPGKWVATGELVLLDNRPKFRELIASTNGAHNSLANARLIAAAPEMAEMIQKMLDRSVQMDPFTEQEARALLDKVNG